jgi:hypothetical protein
MNDIVTISFLRCNRLACLLAVAAFAISECLALFKLLPVVLEPGEVLAIEALALVAVVARRSSLGAMWLPVIVILGGGTVGLFAATLGLRGQAALSDGFGALFASGLCFIVVAGRLRGPRWDRLFSSLASAACLFVGAIIAWSLLDTAVKYLPLVYDPVLYRIDFMLHLNGLYDFALVLNSHPDLYHFILIMYKYNLVWVVPTIFSEAFYTRASAATVTLQLLVSSFLVFPLFCSVPALASAFFFGQAFPLGLPATATLAPHVVVAPVASIRNTFPSLHASWAILALLALRDSPRWHVALGTGFVAITFVATLGFGEHYAVDWVAALPVVLLTRVLCAPAAKRVRLEGGLTAVILLLCWIAEVRLAPANLDWPWALRGVALASLVLPVWLDRRLAQAERAA